MKLTREQTGQLIAMQQQLGALWVDHETSRLHNDLETMIMQHGDWDLCGAVLEIRGIDTDRLIDRHLTCTQRAGHPSGHQSYGGDAGYTASWPR